MSQSSVALWLSSCDRNSDFVVALGWLGDTQLDGNQLDVNQLDGNQLDGNQLHKTK